MKKNGESRWHEPELLKTEATKEISPLGELVVEGISKLKRHMHNLSTKGTDQFDPTNVEMYHGRTFVTESGSEYKITEDGKISGRESIEGAEVYLVAGLPDEWQLPAKLCLNYEMPKSKLVDIVLTHGEKAKEGQALAIVLSDKSTLETKRYGLITTKIKTIK